MSVNTVALQANEAIVDAFSNVDVSAEGHEPIRGIFTGPIKVAKLEGGGFVDAQRPTLIVKSSEAAHLVRRNEVTLQFENGTSQRYLVVLPEDDGLGRLKLTLGHHNVERRSESSAISY
ncbi:head-tail joining protein [Photobacterium atrarenae]|uniref:Head-tail joining protein n=1 Tax=Photobacterium atrarenae TaxID=865757 RepID=A0ABY5GB63_9GAMM|nr:head-tail joining protein [Photobacterium atrarenae]UTV26387.1 head-tail joining protein [Photobacterium atrarenae]